MQGWHRRLLWKAALALFVFGGVTPAFADGAQWLSDQANADGSIARPGDVATAQQATAETLQTFAALGVDDPAIEFARQFIESETFAGTDQLARRIVLRSRHGQDASDLLATLVGYRNADGGFGGAAGHDNTVLDTALALEALAAAGRSDGVPGFALSYLLDTQDADGGWHTGDNPSSVYLTARALIALWPYRAQFNLTNAIDNARNYLLSQRNADHLWDEPHLSALSLTAIVPTLVDRSPVQASLDALAATQAPDGSFGQDVYVTALVLRALNLAVQPAPDEIIVSGRVLESDTGQPMQGVQATLTGPAASSQATGGDGTFRFRDLAPGSYQLELARDGYFPVTANTTVESGDRVDFGDIALVKDTGQGSGATTGTIKGTVTDGNTSRPLADASVVIEGGASASTLADGSYQITNVPEGSATITASAPGYRSVTANATIPGGGLAIFSPSLQPDDGQTPEGAIVTGTVTEADTGQPLQGVAIDITGDATASDQTEAQGRYEITGLGTGEVQITASLSGYDPAIAQTNLDTNEKVVFSPVLYTAGNAPPDANTASVTGTVLNSATSEPIEGAAVAASWGSSSAQATTDADGVFVVDGINSDEVVLDFLSAGFVDVSFNMPLDLGADNDIGQVRLRPEDLQQLLPDVTIGADYLLTVDPQNLRSTGTIDAIVRNQGSAETEQAISLQAFVERDGERGFTPGADLTLGKTEYDASLPVDGEVPLQISIDEHLAFRGEPIHVVVDPANKIAEANEGNNLHSSGAACVGAPLDVKTLDPVVKWHWNDQKVLATPLVGPLLDTDEDGEVTEADDTAVIVVSHTGFVDGSRGYLRALDGETGQQIWAVTSSSLHTEGSTHPAFGDIDGDGQPEVVMYLHDGGVAAINNDGSPKWSTSLPGRAGQHNYGAISIADLDADGLAEILVRDHVLNHDGSLRWAASVSISHATYSVPADLDNDSIPEVLMGGYAFRADGSDFWDNSRSMNGRQAVANFDADDNPEVVLVRGSEVHLLDQNGSFIWSAAMPGGGGGAPTIGDMDGDGRPEIGVAGRNNYVVFDEDGSILWTAPTSDYSSKQTGSTVFDFDGDGQSEVIYADENRLRVYDGETGAERLNTYNRSATATEYPVVADIDGDDNAELLVVSDGGSTSGIRALEHSQDAWMPTRAVWSQHAYYINNIEDDAGIPLQEDPSWLTHNSYRLNTFPERSPLDQPDLTASFIRVTDNGQGQPLTLSVRTGNAGLLTTPAGVEVSFYDGDPAEGGALLGTVPAPELAPGEYADVELDGVSGLTPATELYAVVDSGEAVGECDETNNVHHVPVSVSMAVGGITVSTDSSTYGPDQDAVLEAGITNTGSLAAEYLVELRIEDANGALVASFDPVAVGPLASGESAQLSQVWNTGATLAGDYVLRGILTEPDGDLVAEDTAAFEIGSAAGIPAASLRTTTDKPEYHTTDVVSLNNLVKNLTPNAVIDGATLRLTVSGPTGAVAHAAEIPLGQLAPGAVREVPDSLGLDAAPQGEWSVEGELLDVDGDALANDTADFIVAADPRLALSGEVDALLDVLNRREEQTCADTVTNVGDGPLTGRPLRRQVVNLDAETLVSEETETVDLAVDESKTLTLRVFGTAALEPGHYACNLQTEIDGDWRTLDYAAFEILPAEVQIGAELTLGERGRLLVLLDDRDAPHAGDLLCDAGASLQLETELVPDLPPDATVQIELFDAVGTLLDVETLTLGSADGEINLNTGTPVDLAIPEVSLDSLLITLTGNDLAGLLGDGYEVIATIQDGADQYTLETGRIDLTCDAQATLTDVLSDTFALIGIDLGDTDDGRRRGDGIDTVAAADQRTFLETLLTEAGWNYTLVSDRDAFARELRSGHYAAYFLLNEYRALDEQVQKELREAVFRGEGLVVAGRHDTFNRILDKPLGVKYKGTHLEADGMQLAASPLHAGGQVFFAEIGDAVQRVRLDGATAAGTLIRDGTPVHDVLATTYGFGQGRAAYAGFDLLAEAAIVGQLSDYATLLTNAVEHVHPPQDVAVAGRTRPLQLTITNQGIATPATVTVETSTGPGVVAATAGQVESDGRIDWSLDLTEGASETLDFWVALPEDGTPVTVTAHVVSTGDGDSYEEAELTLQLTPVVLPDLAEAIDELQVYVNANRCTTLTCLLWELLGLLLPSSAERALAHLQDARSAVNANQSEAALEHLTAAADDLADVYDAQAIAPIRVMVGNAIGRVGRTMP